MYVLILQTTAYMTQLPIFILSNKSKRNENEGTYFIFWWKQMCTLPDGLWWWWPNCERIGMNFTSDKWYVPNDQRDLQIFLHCEFYMYAYLSSLSLTIWFVVVLCLRYFDKSFLLFISQDRNTLFSPVLLTTRYAICCSPRSILDLVVLYYQWNISYEKKLACHFLSNQKK